MSTEHRRFLKHFLEFRGSLRGYLHIATGSHADAEDLLQEVSAVLWEKFERYEEGTNFKAWCFACARLEVLKWRQKKARDRLVLAEDALSLLEAAIVKNPENDQPLHEQLHHCLKQLKSHSQAVVDMRYFRGLAIREIAERLSTTIAAIEMTLVRIRRALRECVDQRMSVVGGHSHDGRA